MVENGSSGRGAEPTLAGRNRTVVEIADYPPPPGAWSLRIEFVAAELESRGHRCVRLNTGRSRRLGNPQYANVRGPLDYVLRVIGHAARGHVIHTHTNAKGIKGTCLALVAQLICLAWGRRCVLTFHAGVQQQYFPRTGTFWLDRLMWLVFHTPRYILCNSPAIKSRITGEYGVADEKVFAIPAFCDAYLRTQLGTLSSGVASFAQRHDPLLVSYVFFFHPEFTVDLMVRAVQRLRRQYGDLGLIIIGSTRYAEEYLPMIVEAGLSEHVLLAGNLPREEFLAVLKQGALYLRTPMGDGVAASVLEALSLGTPVVASDNGTRPPGCVCYRGGDLEDMLAKIAHVLENRERSVAQIVPPKAGDTVEEEIELILSAAVRGRKLQGSRP